MTLHHGTHSGPQVMKPSVEREDAVTQSKTTERTHLREEKKIIHSLFIKHTELFGY